MTTGVSVMWALYNCIGPYLLLHYTWVGRGRGLRRASRYGMMLSGLILAAAVYVVWLVAPADYDFAEARLLCCSHVQAWE